MWGDWGDTLITGGEVFALAYMVSETAHFLNEETIGWALDWERSDDEILDLTALALAITDDVDDEVDSIAGSYGWMIAGNKLQMGGLFVRALASSSKVQKAFFAWLGHGPKTVTVYIAMKKGKAVYVGITNDLIRRGNEHGLKLKEFMGGLTRNQARAIEQQIIKANPQFTNIINSVDPKHRFAQWAETWAKRMIGGKKIKF
jgi:hypothetical protein